MKTHYIYNLISKNDYGQEEKMSIISDLDEEKIRSILNYDVEVVSCKEYPKKL